MVVTLSTKSSVNFAPEDHKSEYNYPDPISDPICRYAFCVSNVETLPSF